MFVSLVLEDRSPIAVLRLSDHFNRPGIIEKGNNLDDMTRGFAYQPQKNTDVYFDKEVSKLEMELIIKEENVIKNKNRIIYKVKME